MLVNDNTIYSTLLKCRPVIKVSLLHKAVFPLRLRVALRGDWFSDSYRVKTR